MSNDKSIWSDGFQVGLLIVSTMLCGNLGHELLSKQDILFCKLHLISQTGVVRRLSKLHLTSMTKLLTLSLSLDRLRLSARLASLLLANLVWDLLWWTTELRTGCLLIFRYDHLQVTGLSVKISQTWRVPSLSEANERTGASTGLHQWVSFAYDFGTQSLTLSVGHLAIPYHLSSLWSCYLWSFSLGLGRELKPKFSVDGLCTLIVYGQRSWGSTYASIACV